MKPYGALFQARVRVLLQYRAAALAGMVTQLFWGFIRIAIFAAFYRSSTRPQEIPFSDLVSYVWLGQATLGLLPFGPDPDVRSLIRSGAVAYEMLRPLDLYWNWYVRATARRVVPTTLRALPLLSIAFLFLGLRMPASLGSGLAWMLTTGGAVLLGSAFTNLLSISLFWTISGDGIARIAPLMAYILSGIVLPIAFYPAWMQPLLRFLPFRGLVDTPIRLYIGQAPAAEAGGLLMHQIAWTAVFVFLGRSLLARSMHRLIVQGG